MTFSSRLLLLTCLSIVHARASEGVAKALFFPESAFSAPVLGARCADEYTNLLVDMRCIVARESLSFMGVPMQWFRRFSFAFLAIGVCLAPPGASAKTLLEYDFENFKLGDVQGSPSFIDPGLTSAYDMANNGVEDFGPPNNKLSMTRFAGSQVYPSLNFSLSAPLSLDAIEFLHIHNHNPGFPTYPEYNVDLQLDSGSGFQSLAVFAAKPGGYASELIAGPGSLASGSYSLRWIPLVQPDTDTEFFGLDNIRFRQNDVPGPLPVLGFGAAFGFSRRLRRRLRTREER